jgi:FAD/FMN-containing dehydrogenase
MKALLSLPWFALAAQCTPVSLSGVEARSDDLNSCLDAAALQYVDAFADTWDTAILPHNMRVPVTPRAIVYATAVEHVQSAVACAAANGLKVAAKSGGHSYGSYGLGGSDGHLVIQLDQMFQVTLRDDNTALVQTGSRLGHVALELWNQGKRAIVHGTCPR